MAVPRHVLFHPRARHKGTTESNISLFPSSFRACIEEEEEPQHSHLHNLTPMGAGDLDGRLQLRRGPGFDIPHANGLRSAAASETMSKREREGGMCRGQRKKNLTPSSEPESSCPSATPLQSSPYLAKKKKWTPGSEQEQCGYKMCVCVCVGLA